MAWHRRWNENNVDLNRNWLENQKYPTQPGYFLFNSIINPGYRLPWHDPISQLPTIAWAILRHGFKVMKDAIASGQGDFPKGLFFAGDEFQKEPQILVNHFRAVFSACRLSSHFYTLIFTQDWVHTDSILFWSRIRAIL
jgi:hypothetical protein